MSGGIDLDDGILRAPPSMLPRVEAALFDQAALAFTRLNLSENVVPALSAGYAASAPVRHASGDLERRSAPPSPRVTTCASQGQALLSNDWYWHSGTPHIDICAWCFQRRILGTRFQFEFTLRPTPPCARFRCVFTDAEVASSWEQVVQWNDLQPFERMLRARGNLPQFAGYEPMSLDM